MRQRNLQLLLLICDTIKTNIDLLKSHTFGSGIHQYRWFCFFFFFASRSHSLRLHWIFPEYRFEHGFFLLLCVSSIILLGEIFWWTRRKSLFGFFGPIKINLNYKQIKENKRKKRRRDFDCEFITKWISVKSRTQKAQLSLTHRAFYTQQQYDEWNDNGNGVKKNVYCIWYSLGIFHYILAFGIRWRLGVLVSTAIFVSSYDMTISLTHSEFQEESDEPNHFDISTGSAITSTNENL